jgi:hypothetical protein
VLDGIGAVGGVAWYACLIDRLHQEATRRTDERLPLPVLLVTRLLADKYDARVRVSG